MSRTDLRLSALNAWRWILHHGFEWGLLGAVYSLAAALLVEPAAQHLLEKFQAGAPGARTVGWRELWILIWIFITLPFFLERYRGVEAGLPLFRSKNSRNSKSLSFIRVYFMHELRRWQGWASALVVVLFGSIALEIRDLTPFFFVFIAQFSVQRALYSIGSWRRLISVAPHLQSPAMLWNAFLCVQLFWFVLSWAALGAVMWIEYDWLSMDFLPRPVFPLWLTLGVSGGVAVIAGASVALEGDSGRPWLVNLLAFTAGTMGGLITLAAPIWGFLGAVYFASRLRALSRGRLLSVENFHEDFVVP